MLPVKDLITAKKLARTNNKSGWRYLWCSLVQKTMLPSNTPRKAVPSLSKDHSITILPAAQWYTTQAWLSDNTTYEALKRDPKGSYKKKVTECLQQLEKRRSPLYYQFYPGEVTPCMYGLPKIHKEEAPHIWSINLFNYSIVKHLAPPEQLWLEMLHITSKTPQILSTRFRKRNWSQIKSCCHLMSQHFLHVHLHLRPWRVSENDYCKTVCSKTWICVFSVDLQTKARLCHGLSSVTLCGQPLHGGTGQQSTKFFQGNNSQLRDQIWGRHLGQSESESSRILHGTGSSGLVTWREDVKKHKTPFWGRPKLQHWSLRKLTDTD